jgi:signal transduction histidine kinase
MKFSRGKGIQRGVIISLREKRRRVIGDRTRLQQVFWNLLNNASKFTPKGGEVRIQSRSKANRIATIVSDNGIGIDPDTLPHLQFAYSGK